MSDVERPAAEPITSVIADRVRQLRTGRGVSQADLADKMVSAGRTTWTRATVVNLERRAASNTRATGAENGRDSVSVQELLALARVLNVPPAWLLADPTAETTPIAEGAEPDAATALLWIVGRKPLDDQRAEGDWLHAARVIAILSQISGLVAALERRRYSEPIPLNPDDDPAVEKEMTDRMDRSSVKNIRLGLRELIDAGFRLPSIPLYVQERAKELGLDFNVEG